MARRFLNAFCLKKFFLRRKRTKTHLTKEFHLSLSVIEVLLGSSQSAALAATGIP